MARRTQYAERTVYMAEKFLPTQCPNPACRNEFKEMGRNGYGIAVYWLHEPKEITEEIRSSTTFPGLATDLIVCAKCGNVTLRVKIEDLMCATRAEAEEALTKGFVNLQEMIQYGAVSLGRFVYRNIPNASHEEHY